MTQDEDRQSIEERTETIDFDTIFGPEKDEDEPVVLPGNDIPAVEYIAGVLSQWYPQSDNVQKATKRFMDIAAVEGERENALICLLEGFLHLDYKKRDIYYLREEITPEDAKKKADRLIFTAAIERISHEFEDYHQYGDFYENLVDVALATVRSLNVTRMIREKNKDEPCRQGYSFMQFAYDKNGYEESLDDVLGERDRTMLGMQDNDIKDETLAVAQRLVGWYPVLEEKELREQASSPRELSYIISSSLAIPFIDTPELRQDADTILHSKAPPRLKWMTILHMVGYDNCIRLGNIIRDTTLEGYNDKK